MARGTWQGSGTWQSSGPDLGSLGKLAALIAAAAALVALIAQVIIWLAVITAILVAGSAAALVLTWRSTRRREAAYEASPQHRRVIAATVTPQVTQGTQPRAIEQHVHIHLDPADRDAVRLIRSALPGAHAITEEQLCAGHRPTAGAGAPEAGARPALRPTARPGSRSAPASAATASSAAIPGSRGCLASESSAWT